MPRGQRTFTATLAKPMTLSKDRPRAATLPGPRIPTLGNAGTPPKPSQNRTRTRTLTRNINRTEPTLHFKASSRPFSLAHAADSSSVPPWAGRIKAIPNLNKAAAWTFVHEPLNRAKDNLNGFVPKPRFRVGPMHKMRYTAHDANLRVRQAAPSKYAKASLRNYHTSSDRIKRRALYILT